MGKRRRERVGMLGVGGGIKGKGGMGIEGEGS